jgi:hypothetical protein
MQMQVRPNGVLKKKVRPNAVDTGSRYFDFSTYDSYGAGISIARL